MNLKNREGLTEKQFLEGYDDSKYGKPSVTVDMIVFTVDKEQFDEYSEFPEKKLKILMIKRGNHPCLGQWALPGGFVEIEESLEEAVARELKEETNAENVYFEQLYTWGDVDRDKRKRIISVSYLALIDANSQSIYGGSDASEAKWFTVTSKVIKDEKRRIVDGYESKLEIELILQNGQDKLSSVIEYTKRVQGDTTGKTQKILDKKGIAFDHSKIIVYGLDRLRAKLWQTDIAASLMPKKFTLAELQNLYEVILGEKLLTTDFYRKIGPLMAKDIGEIREDYGDKESAELYKFVF